MRITPTRKQTPGISYRILSQSGERAILQCQYHCPYCMRKSTARSIVYPPDYDRLETGGFCDALPCSECGETAHVRFWRAMRTE